jgi:putative hydrolase of the HAD superfamily
MSADSYLIWDFDGTLATRTGGWAGTLCETAATIGARVEHAAVAPHLRRGFPWHSPDVGYGECSGDEWWERLFPVLESALVEGAAVDPDDARGLARRVRDVYLEPARWEVFDDTLPVLAELRRHGWRHLMLSNHVPELPRIVEVLGLEPFFDAIYCSADIGVEKPSARIFERVFDDHPTARDGWMIGDSFSADVMGARGVGLRAILVRREHADATLRCETLRDVIRVIAE